MDYLVPIIALLVGVAILAPGVVRQFRKKESSGEGCGGCSGCSNSGAAKGQAVQLVQLRRKK